ncbi:MAG TPA: S8 family serine peptidase [Kineosporiaceae bacterium]|nr:S8 family serine peptidase [Kineosporiaceae bacterium]
MTQRIHSPGLRRLTVAATWLGTAALVVGGSSAAVAVPSEGEALVTPSVTDTYTLASPSSVAPVPSTDTVAGEYVVVLKDNAELRADGMPTASTSKQVKTAVAHGRKLGAVVQDQFTDALAGYRAKLSAAELAAVKADPTVDYVQPNRTYKVSGTTQKNPISWGLDRIDQRSLPLNKAYYSTATGSGVTAYIIDSGLVSGHPDLPNAEPGFSVLGGDSEDCNGHGTHVAGTIGGTEFGMAKKVTLVPVRVFDCSGGGTTADVVAGIDLVLQQPVTGPRVVNMSLGSDDIDPAVDDGVTRMIDAGITVVLAAGNGDENGHGVSACSVSPAHVKAAITVGATNKKDQRADFSNYGSCVDLYAPGVDIASAYLNDKKGKPQYAFLSGTSMAAPHVAGAAAMYLQRHPKATPAQVQAALIKAATKDKVTNVSKKWPRLELFWLQKAVVPTSVTKGNNLEVNESLVKGNTLCSTGGVYCLNHGSAGALRVRKVKGTKQRTLWSAGKNAAWTTMTKTGALSSYDSYGRRVWTSEKTGGKATLYVGKNGYLKILRNSDKKVLWTSKG